MQGLITGKLTLGNCVQDLFGSVLKLLFWSKHVPDRNCETNP